MKMKHMAEKAGKNKIQPPEVASGNGDGGSSGPTYPYGLELHLNDDSMGKLGMKGLPKVGSHMHIHAKAHVSSVSHNAHKGGKPSRSVHLQIHHMAVSDEPESAVEAVSHGIEEANE